MIARKLFSMSEEEIKEYFQRLDLPLEFKKERKYFPTTLDERLFGLTHYSKPCAMERKLIKKFPILRVNVRSNKISLVRGRKIIRVAVERGIIQVTKIRC